MSLKKNDTQRISSGVQEQFFERLRQCLHPGLGIAEEVAALLNVSTDSAYRRIRGETDLTFDEVSRLVRKYPMSLDDILHNRNDSVSFNYTKLTDSSTNFESYLTRLVEHMKLLNKFPDKKIYYVAEEMPLFYSFYSPIFTDFKLYYWQRSVLNCREYQQTQYRPGLVPESLVRTAKAAFTEYLSIPSVEVWTDLTVLTGLRQVGFYFDSGVLDKEQALQLFHEYRRTIELLQKCAETGRKTPGDAVETFQLYASEVVLGTNCIYTVMGGNKYSFISFNTLNSLTTNNPQFCEETEHWMRNLERKSTLISGVAEKQRYQFFNSMYRKIDEYIGKTADS